MPASNPVRPVDPLPAEFAGPDADLVPCRVLVVEDVPDSREMLRVLLEALGHQVEVAADGVQGLHKALSWRPDKAVLDIGLPRMDGYELARRVRAALGDAVFLIALTGYGQDQDRRQAFEAGFNVHLTKPADPEVLDRLLRRPAAAPPDLPEGPGPVP